MAKKAPTVEAYDVKLRKKVTVPVKEKQEVGNRRWCVGTTSDGRKIVTFLTKAAYDALKI